MNYFWCKLCYQENETEDINESLIITILSETDKNKKCSSELSYFTDKSKVPHLNNI